MSLSANRREVIAGAGAAAVVAPMLRPATASAKNGDLRVSLQVQVTCNYFLRFKNLGFGRQAGTTVCRNA